MTEHEFDIMDELHFVHSFAHLLEATRIAEDPLKTALHGLAAKGWIKVLRDADNEVPLNEADFAQGYARYHYLATKQGLLAFHSTAC